MAAHRQPSLHKHIHTTQDPRVLASLGIPQEAVVRGPDGSVVTALAFTRAPHQDQAVASPGGESTADGQRKQVTRCLVGDLHAR
jgi:hypothetical protein